METELTRAGTAASLGQAQSGDTWSIKRPMGGSSHSEEQFKLFMNLVLPLYNDPCACVIVYISPSKVRDLIMECLIKLIQQRYGYSSYIVNDLEDIYYIKDDMSFTPRGIVTMQADSDRALLEGYYGPIVIPKE